MDVENFKSTITEFHNKFKKPIWITEWACQNYGSNQNHQCSQDQINTFMRETQAWLDSTPWVERYAYFAPITKFPGGFNTKNRLMSSSGAITPLGQDYIRNTSEEDEKANDVEQPPLRREMGRRVKAKAIGWPYVA
ncbi:hypothetical protein FRB90_010355 [Tulasnella sp. 427]|nr:hypothetical protein FRB90_010355 [Tulasnella sp. 427]